MVSFKIIGGKKLSGIVHPQGAKNEALQIIAGTLLTKNLVTIRNIPQIIDVLCLIDILKGLGVKIKKTRKNTYSFQANDINIDYLKTPDFKKNSQKIRGSVMIMGPLLARFGKTVLYPPG